MSFATILAGLDQDRNGSNRGYYVRYSLIRSLSGAIIELE